MRDIMIKRKFLPGSEWLYLKIYTGVKTADLVLEEAVQPIIEDFQKKGYISKWFFIRYHDPKPHLRLRLQLKAIEVYAHVFEEINEVLQEYLNSGEISSLLVDTYTREIERYGENTMEDSETLFHKNSEFTLQCLHYNDEEKIITSLFYIDEILNKIGLSAQGKLDWMKDFNASFKQEFHADKKLNSQLDKKYREFKPKFLDFIRSEEFIEERKRISDYIKESNSA
ncbi:thiopeptide-type bacteriocin biosynthesis protein, partial [uncultured Chryseobacterium sp.]|uniref:thiopeptide-type bacteriocin biosynthesis protein n=1 Tax=uncultured Chryseobacterium sp. TaxID=259322 RepID=UPI002602DE26